MQCIHPLVVFELCSCNSVLAMKSVPIRLLNLSFTIRVGDISV